MIGNKGEYRYYLKSDMQSFGLTKWKWTDRYKYPTLHFQRVLRKVEYYSNCRKDAAGKIARLWWRYRLFHLSVRLGFTIPINVFGPGLNIAHYGSIVVNGNARIGSNCRIHSATNIGEAKGECPVIGDNVYIGPGAILYGDIVVGDNVAVGANSVVNRDVPSNVTVAGIPARIISERGTESLLIRGTEAIAR